MKLIAHRGNYRGPNPERENEPGYVFETLTNTPYYVEVDLRLVNGALHSGHDAPQYVFPTELLAHPRLYVHAKDIRTLWYMRVNHPEVHTFFHDSDDVVLTSQGELWTYPGRELTPLSIAVMPEVAYATHSTDIAGICSDHLEFRRTECVCCSSEKLAHLHTVSQVPLTSSTLPIPRNTKIDMIFGKCVRCKTIQLTNLADPAVLYETSHNSSVVGETWTTHYSTFATVIKPYVRGAVLDIGDPSFKVGKYFTETSDRIPPEHIGVWTSVDPNCTVKHSQNQVIVSEFFEKALSNLQEVDTIIHSHLFEHVYNPSAFLSQCRTLLREGGYMCFSVPNMEKTETPFAGVFLEHTFHLSKPLTAYLLAKAGFEIVVQSDYRAHSTFYVVKKSEASCNIESVIEYNESLEFRVPSYEDVSEPVYLYGSHYNSQIRLAIQPNLKVISILDNDPLKIGSYLDGFAHKVESPAILVGLSNPIVLVSHCSVYKDEIASQIRALNQSVVIR